MQAQASPACSQAETIIIFNRSSDDPYRGPRSPLDLIAIEIILGCLFEVFRHTSQAAGTGTSIDNDIQPQKKMRQPSLKKILVPR
jgi:hypothetical protein